jgi:hypothetical protein
MHRLQLRCFATLVAGLILMGCSDMGDTGGALPPRKSRIPEGKVSALHYLGKWQGRGHISWPEATFDCSNVVADIYQDSNTITVSRVLFECDAIQCGDGICNRFRYEWLPESMEIRNSETLVSVGEIVGHISNVQLEYENTRKEDRLATDTQFIRNGASILNLRETVTTLDGTERTAEARLVRTDRIR